MVKKTIKDEKVEQEKKHGFMDVLKDGLSFISSIAAASIMPPVTEGANTIIKNIEEKMMLMEKRILRTIYSSLIMGFGGIFLIFALFFLLTDHFGWSNAAAFFSIGITIFVIGLLVKLGDTNR